MIKVQSLILNAGYVEDSKIASVFMFHETGFASVEEALQSIGNALVEEYKIPEYVPQCCQKAQENEDRFCPRCGRRIPKFVEINFDIVRALMSEFMSGTINDVGDYYNRLEEAGWQIGCPSEEYAMRLFEHPFAIVHAYAAGLVAHCYLGSVEREKKIGNFNANLAQHVYLQDKNMKIYGDEK